MVSAAAYAHGYALGLYHPTLPSQHLFQRRVLLRTLAGGERETRDMRHPNFEQKFQK